MFLNFFVSKNKPGFIKRHMISRFNGVKNGKTTWKTRQKTSSKITKRAKNCRVKCLKWLDFLFNLKNKQQKITIYLFSWIIVKNYNSRSLCILPFSCLIFSLPYCISGLNRRIPTHAVYSIKSIWQNQSQVLLFQLVMRCLVGC